MSTAPSGWNDRATPVRLAPAKGRLPDTPVGRLRAAVFLSAVVATTLKLEIAARTFGTNEGAPAPTEGPF